MRLVLHTRGFYDNCWQPKQVLCTSDEKANPRLQKAHSEGQTRHSSLTFAWLIRSPTNVDTSMERDTDALFLRASALLKGKTEVGGSSGTVTVYD